MPMKYAFTKDGNIKAVNGHPVVIDEDDNEEISLDAIDLYSKVPMLQKEAKNRRLELREAKKKLETYKKLGIEDPEEFSDWKNQAENALETLSSIDRSKLVEAGRIDEVRQIIKEEMQTKIDKIKKQASDREKEFQNSVAEKDTTIRRLMVDDKFNTSSYIGSELIITPKMARKIFGDQFKVEKTEDGKTRTIGYLGDEPIMSKQKIGEYAPFDEALKIMIDNDPDTDAYKKAADPKGNVHTGSHRFTQTPAAAQTDSSVEKIRKGLEARAVK